uniref:MTP large subunit lipid-binding domain-containing protein n=1 Tax=Setaria digitata TaxID=48799 RepID=A0A915PZW0_9BILA
MAKDIVRMNEERLLIECSLRFILLKSILQKSSKFVDEKGHDLGLIVNSILFTTAEDLLDSIKEFRNTSVMPLFVDALGLTGTRTSYNVCKNAFSTVAPEFLERFLQALSHSTKIDMIIINDLAAWMKDTNDEYIWKHLAFAVATLYRRYCESTKSLKFACENGKDKTISKLLRIFDNTCPLRQTVADQTLAVEILLNILPHTELIGTYLLRSEKLFPTEHEKWAYFYKSTARRREASEDVKLYWNKMRSFRVFQPNYAHRSLKATSDVSTITIAELGNNNITVWIRTANDQGILSWNDVSISLISKQKYPLHLMEMFVETRGLKTYLLDSENNDNDENDDNDNDPLARAQISLTNNRMPPITIFDGYSEMLNSLWNADGQPMLLYDTNLIYRQYYGYVPLMSGLSLTLDIMGTISVALYGSASISFWNKDAKTIVNSTISTKLEGSLSLASENNLIGKATTLMEATGTVNIRFDADFFAVPHLFCTTISHSPFVIR